MSRALAALIGGAVGALALVGIIIFVVWFFILERKILRASQSGSSAPSIQDIERSTCELPLIGGPLPSASQEARCFSLQELELATKNFTEINPIGQGSFGPVYKGLLQDGVVVAIKRRAGAPRQEFIDEARNLRDFNDTVAVADEKLGGTCMAEVVKEFMELVVCCIHSCGQRRPTMRMVASELERIYEKEISLTTIVGEGNPTVILASQLFTA